jgi:ATP-dependent exoDNAse (exonuclease V) beta subunit
VDETAESPGGTISAFNGIKPIIETFADPDREAVAVGDRLADCIADGDAARRNRDRALYNTERHLLYVACTRGRDHLPVTGVDPASEFLVDVA